MGLGGPVISISWAAVKRVSRITLAALIVAYLAVSAFYIGSFRLQRSPDAITIATPASLAAEAERLAKAYAAGTGVKVELVGEEPGSDGAAMTADTTGGADPAALTNLARLLSSGAADCVLAEVGSLDPDTAVAARGARPFYVPTLLSVTFPSPHTAVTLEEARAIVADLAAGRPGPWADADLQAIALADRSPARQPLSVEGVYPTLESVVSGTYPLSREVRLYVRRGPAGFFGLLGRLPVVKRWLQPNVAAVREFASWLGTPEGQAALYGTGTEITLTAVGDVWFARNVAKAIDENGTGYPFALVADRLAAADITWCDLESPLGVGGYPLPGKLIWFRAKPETVACLKPPGVDVVCLANNHILDYDSPCLLETLDTLDGSGIAYCGAGRDAAEAREPAIIEADGLKVAFLAYTEYADTSLFWSHAYPRTFLAGEGIPGCNPLYLDLVAEDIAKAKTEVDLVVVCYHWGRENTDYPSAYHPWNDLPDIARRTIDLGACLVLGTHPHAVQGFEARAGGLIAYSLGNFVTDQIEEDQKEGLILEVELGPSGVLSARLTPVWSEGFRPTIMENEQAKALLEKVERISQPYRPAD